MAMGRYLMHNIMTAQRPRAHFFWKDNAPLRVSIIQDRDFIFESYRLDILSYRDFFSQTCFGNCMEKVFCSFWSDSDFFSIFQSLPLQFADCVLVQQKYICSFLPAYHETLKEPVLPYDFHCHVAQIELISEKFLIRDLS